MGKVEGMMHILVTQLEKQEFDVTRDQWFDNDSDNYFRAHATKVKKGEDPAHTCAGQSRQAVQNQVLDFTVCFVSLTTDDDWQSNV